MTSTAELKQLAAESVGRDIWPFVALDWYAHRAATEPNASRDRHLKDCVNQLHKENAPWPWSLQATVVVAAELMGGDAAAVEAACQELMKTRPRDESHLVDQGVLRDLRAAGLTSSALNRLGVSAGPHRASAKGSAMSTIRSPKVFVSYSHEGESLDGRWNESVRAFTDLLVERGIDAHLDQYGTHMDKDWSLWGPALIRACDIVVCLASPDFARKWGMARGSGVSAEARTIRSAWEKGEISLLFVILPGRSADDRPKELGDVHFEVVKTIDRVGIEGVYRELTNQPPYTRPPLGPIEKLPSR